MRNASAGHPSSSFADGESLSHLDLQHRLYLRTASEAKAFVIDHGIPYMRLGVCWWVDSSDVRAALKAGAKPHAAWRAELAAADGATASDGGEG